MPAPLYPINDDSIVTPAPTAPPYQALSLKDSLSGGQFGDSGNHSGQTTITLQPLLTAPDYFTHLYPCSHGNPPKETVWDYMPYGPFTSPAAMRDFYQKAGDSGDPQFYAVMHNNQTPAGIVSYLRLAPAAYSIEIGHIWHAIEHQRGIANTASAFLLIDNAFNLGYRRVEWKCNALNDKSCLAALRLGFAFEGIFRQHTVFKGKNRDTAWFAIIDKNWHDLRCNYLRWFTTPTPFSLSEANRPFVEWSLPVFKAWKGEII